MRYSEKVTEQLNQLLEKNYDAEAGYIAAKEKVNDPELKNFFKNRATDRYDFGHELKEEIKQYAEEPNKGTSIKGDIHRMWMDLKSSISQNNEEAILEEAVRGEEKALKNYNEILDEMTLAPSTQKLLEKQRDSVKSALKLVKTFEQLS